MHLHVLCARCGARLAPTLSGLRCPRLTACGFGGHVETIRRSFAFPGAQAGRAEA